MIVKIDGESFEASPISDCSYGNTVKYQRKDNSKGASANEMVVIGLETASIPNPGKF